MVLICISLVSADVEHLFLCCLPSAHPFHKMPIHVFSSLWWVVLCVNVTRLRDTQICGRTLFLLVFTEEISIWIGKLKWDSSHLGGWASPNMLRAWIEQKGREKGICSSCWSWDIHIPIILQTSEILVFRPSDLNWIIPLLFLALRLAEGRLWCLTAITAWANSYDRSISNQSIYPISSVSLENLDQYSYSI